MTPFKTILMTAAMMAVPAAAFAQVSTDAVTDQVKDKAVDTAVDAVMDNATTENMMVAGETMIKGGSKEDAAMAVVKNRVDNKIDGMTDGAVSMDGVSTDGMMDAGKDMAKDKVMGAAEGHSSATTHSSAKTYTDKAPSSAATYGSAVIPKSGMTAPAPAPAPAAAPAATLPPVNCPAGTKGMPDGTCMVTGNWNPS